jgi:transposase InsO family protein
MSSSLRSAGICASACPTATSKNSSPTRRRGRPRHHLPLGAAVHAGASCGRPAGPPRGRDRWQVDETYVKMAGHWRYVYRAVDQFGQVIDVLVSAR